MPYSVFLSYRKRSKAELLSIPSFMRWHAAFVEKCYWQIFQKPRELCPSEVIDGFPVAAEERLLEQ